MSLCVPAMYLCVPVMSLCVHVMYLCVPVMSLCVPVMSLSNVFTNLSQSSLFAFVSFSLLLLGVFYILYSIPLFCFENISLASFLFFYCTLYFSIPRPKPFPGFPNFISYSLHKSMQFWMHQCGSPTTRLTLRRASNLSRGTPRYP
jgi:hypothetical protein